MMIETPSTTKAMLMSLGLATLAATPASAAPPLQCQDFVNYAMKAQAQYYARGCPRIPSMHANREGHFQWCLKRNEGQVAAEQRAKAATLNSCLAGAASPPRPQSAQMQSTATREPVCSSYGQAGEKWRNRATAQGCNVAAIPVPRGWASYAWGANQLFSYCMGTSDAGFRGRSAQALGHKVQLEKACSQQLRRPVRL
ncbi:hypothetical protein RPB_0054 [Rhodopseudomonas palustris HaA2]|uniref:Uncharacterized protein n=2 Tax=Rhodopseudomonas palustris TaxID=1076 RepID=Q2J444_RHOP2|nr:hypothetical protein RPB_0054 [Rhodopseudomonas palustris HaA2]